MTSVQLKKHRRIEAIKGWINTLTKNNSYNQELLQPYNGDEFEKMTLKELNLVLNFIKATFSHAYRKGYSDRIEAEKEKNNV